MKSFSVPLTREQVETLLVALEWYADDRREAAKYMTGPDRAAQEAAANTADGTRALLEGLLPASGSGEE